MELTPGMTELLDAMPDGILISTVDGEIRYVNRQVEALTGYRADELVGRPVEVLVPEHRRFRHVEHRDRYRGDHLPVRPMGTGIEIALRRADASEIPVDIALSPLPGADEPLVLSSIRDATERTRAEKAIRASERRWSSLLQNVELAVVGLDRSGTVVSANPCFVDLVGRPAEEVLGADWFECFVPAQARPLVGETFTRVLAEDDGHLVDTTPVVTSTGEHRSITWYHTVLRDSDGTPTGTLSIGEDVTEREEAIARLRAVSEVTNALLAGRDSDDILRIVVRHARELVSADLSTIAGPVEGNPDSLVIRVAAGRFAPDVEGMVFPRDPSISGTVIRSGTPEMIEDTALDDRVYQPVVATGNIGPAVIVPLSARSGPFGTILAGRERGARPFTDRELRLVETFAEQAAMTLEFARAQQELRRLLVFEDRERIARDLHDTVIQRLFATGMALQAVVDLVAPEAAERIQHAIDELDTTIREIRSTIFALETVRRQGKSLRAEVLALAVEAARGLGFEPKVRFDGTIDASVPDDVGEQLLSTLREALSNVARHAHASRTDVLVAVDNKGLQLRVSDDGVGMPESLERTGLGLRNMRERAETLGGSFDVSTPLAGGTVVDWRVPLRRP